MSLLRLFLKLYLHLLHWLRVLRKIVPLIGPCWKPYGL